MIKRVPTLATGFTDKSVNTKIQLIMAFSIHQGSGATFTTNGPIKLEGYIILGLKYLLGQTL